MDYDALKPALAVTTHSVVLNLVELDDASTACSADNAAGFDNSNWSSNTAGSGECPIIPTVTVSVDDTGMMCAGETVEIAAEITGNVDGYTPSLTGAVYTWTATTLASGAAALTTTTD